MRIGNKNKIVEFEVRDGANWDVNLVYSHSWTGRETGAGYEDRRVDDG